MQTGAKHMDITAHGNHAVTKARADIHEPSYQAFQILHWGFVAAPFLAGLDKFFNLLTQWEGYLSPAFARLSPLSAHATMRAVGVVEIVAAVVVAVRPRLGAYVVAAWLVGIMLNLLLLGHGYDVALRDLGLFLGALALGRLSEIYDKPAKTA
jgi:hypothetical protein